MSTERSMRERLPTKRVGAGLLLVDLEGRVLLVKPAYKEGWEIPGGLVEVGESPRAAAYREVLEETGLDRAVGRLLVLDWVRADPPLGDGLMLLFDGGVVGPEASAHIRLPEDELTGHRFVEPTRLGDFLPVHMARRVANALTARDQAVTLDLEDGRRAP